MDFGRSVVGEREVAHRPDLIYHIVGTLSCHNKVGVCLKRTPNVRVRKAFRNNGRHREGDGSAVPGRTGRVKSRLTLSKRK